MVFFYENNFRQEIKGFPLDNTLSWEPLPHAIPSVDFSVIQIIFHAGVKHKLPFVRSIFLAKGKGQWETVPQQYEKIELLSS